MLAGGLLLLVLAAAVVWLMIKARPQPVLPPEITARQALEKLRPLPEDGNLLSRVSQILRHYLTAVFQLPVGETTTAELVTALARKREIHFEVGMAASVFLRECDERKFSPQGQTVPLNAVARALELIDLAEKYRARSAPVPGAALPEAPSGDATQQSHKDADVAASKNGRAP